MNRNCDLHTHSVFSDGTYTPTEIIRASVDLGLSAVALCDHNTVDGLPEFLRAASGKNIEAVAGAEFSVERDIAWITVRSKPNRQTERSIGLTLRLS